MGVRVRYLAEAVKVTVRCYLGNALCQRVFSQLQRVQSVCAFSCVLSAVKKAVSGVCHNSFDGLTISQLRSLHSDLH